MENTVLGNTAQVTFGRFGNRGVEGKVDTGATTSSLHATKIHLNKERGTVTFHSPALGDNLLTLPLDGVQEVHSADAGGVARPVIKLDVEINGVPVQGATFNLNDRSNMDSHVLIGQNILQAGNFTINPNKEEHSAEDAMTREAAVMQAIATLVEHDISLAELLTHLQTVALDRIKE